MPDYVLVTGGAGYVGSHACKALAEAGFAPVSYDNLVNGHEQAVKWGPLEVGDILDHDRLTEVVDRYAIVGAMHFAAFAYVGESVNAPIKYYRNNVAGTFNLIDVLLKKKVSRLVFSSTCAVYGIPTVDVISEETCPAPVSPYGASKLMVERALEDISRANTFRYASLRYFNAAGADLDGKIGEAHDPETHLIPLAFQVAMGKRGPLTIFGGDYPTEDGTCVRDYVHVCDLADAHVRALRHLLNRGENLTVNLGSGQGISVLQIVGMIEAVTGLKVPYSMGKRRPGDPPRLVASNRMARDKLGWQARHSEIETILETAFAWERGRG